MADKEKQRSTLTNLSRREDSTELRKNLYCQLVSSALDSHECPQVDDHKERIKFVLKAVGSGNTSRFFCDLSGQKKCPEKSTKLRLVGNRYFKSTTDASLSKAVEAYTKSVVYAPNGSQELSLAYANRSAVLFRARLISDCLLDIDRALKNNYPDNLKAKLYLRKAMCLQILDSDNRLATRKMFAKAKKWTEKMDEENERIIVKEKIEAQKVSTSIDKSLFSKWENEKFTPKLDRENPMIPGLSDAVELKYSEKYGRHIVAKRNIKPGEILAAQKPYAKTVLPDSIYELCWNCGKQTWASVPCENCVEVLFCSEDCREKGNLEHHNVECPILASMIPLNFPDVSMMPLRLIIKAHKEVGGTIEALRSYLDNVDAEESNLLKGFTNKVLDPNKFSGIYGLEAHMERGTDSRENFLSHAIIIVFLLATKSDFFGSRIDEDLTTLQSDENFIFVIGLFERIIMMSLVNNYRLTVSNKEKTHRGCLGIAPALSFFNHSCNSMTFRTTYGDVAVVRARCPIKKGEQIFDSYGQDYMISPKKERQAHLLAWYNFHCDCEACENDWPAQMKVGVDKNRNQKSSTLLESAMQVLNQKSAITEKLVDSPHRSTKHVYDVTKDVADLIKVIEIFTSHFDRNSMQSSYAEHTLAALLNLLQNRFLSLD